MRIAGIYQIQSTVKPERIYIGSSNCIKVRWKTHLSRLRNNKHHSTKLQSHFNKYGELDLAFSVLCTCDKEDLLTQEQFFIDTHSPWFNICQIAGSNSGLKLSAKTRKRISESLTGQKRSDESKKRMAESQKGNKKKLGYRYSDEQKERIMKTKPKMTEETKRKIGESSRGHIKSAELRKSISDRMKGNIAWNKGKTGLQVAWNKGIPFSDESRKRMSESQLKRPPTSIETRLRMSASRIGGKDSEEVKQHKKDAWAKRRIEGKESGWHLSEETRLKMSISHKNQRERERLLKETDQINANAGLQ